MAFEPVELVRGESRFTAYNATEYVNAVYGRGFTVADTAAAPATDADSAAADTEPAEGASTSGDTPRRRTRPTTPRNEG
ncbi:hypothetical protein ACWEQ4_01285 [Rhodococcus sp. NPDC003994]